MRALAWFLLLGGFGVLAGCKSIDAKRSGRARPDVTAPNAARVAADVLPQLQEAFKPGTTTFRLGSRESSPAIASELEAVLRRAGYAVTEDANEPGALVLLYTIDRFEPDGIRLIVSAGDSFQANRLYVQNDDGNWEPEGALTERVEPVAPGRPKRLRSWAGLLNRNQTVKASVIGGHRPVAGSSAPKIALARPEVPRSVTPPLPVLVNQGPKPASKSTADDSKVRPGDARSPEPDEDTIVLSPNSDGVIEISAALFAGADAAVPDPFVQHYQPKKLSHEFAVTIAGIALGPQPTVVLNDRVYSIGESVDGFRVDAIHEDLVLLKRDNFLLRIPLQEKPVVVRYP